MALAAAAVAPNCRWLPWLATLVVLGIQLPLAFQPFTFDLEGSVEAVYAGPI